MNFEKWDKIIEENKYEMVLIEIYYDLKCNDGFEKLTNKEKEKLINFVYNAYLKDEDHTDLGYLCDKSIEFKDDILNNKDFTTWDLLTECSYIW